MLDSTPAGAVPPLADGPVASRCALSAFDSSSSFLNGAGVVTSWVNLGTATIGFDFDGDSLPDCVDPDDDNDGVGDGLDCANFDRTLWAVPTEARFLELDHAAGVTTLSWNAPASPGTLNNPLYDTIYSKEAFDLVNPASCSESNDGSDKMSFHGIDPPVGDIWNLVVRPENDCGHGPAHFDSAGAQAPALSCP